MLTNQTNYWRQGNHAEQFYKEIDDKLVRQKKDNYLVFSLHIYKLIIFISSLGMQRNKLMKVHRARSSSSAALGKNDFAALNIYK